jgi:hypothetical protein
VVSQAEWLAEATCLWLATQGLNPAVLDGGGALVQPAPNLIIIVSTGTGTERLGEAANGWPPCPRVYVGPSLTPACLL